MHKICKKKLLIVCILLAVLFETTIPATVVKAERTPLKATEIYKLCEKSMVEIRTVTKDDTHVYGSGFFIGEGKIATNFHVIEGAVEMEAVDYDGNTYPVVCIYEINKDIDIAVIGVEGSLDAIVSNTDAPVTGETVYTIGSPYGYTGSFSKGIISKANRIMDGVLCHQISAPISSGNSGGPLLNCYGEVIGINTFTYTNGKHINFSISIENLDCIDLGNPFDVNEFYALNQSK